MEIGLFDGGEDGEYIGVSFVEISKYVRCRTHFSLNQHHLTEFNGPSFVSVSELLM